MFWFGPCEDLYEEKLLTASQLPLLRGDQQCSWLDVDVSRFTLHSAPQIVTLELRGSNPEPVKVSTAPPPKLPELQKQKKKNVDSRGSTVGDE